MTSPSAPAGGPRASRRVRPNPRQSGSRGRGGAHRAHGGCAGTVADGQDRLRGEPVEHRVSGSRHRASSIRSCPIPGNSSRWAPYRAAVARTPRIGTSRSSGVASTRIGGDPSGGLAGRCISSWYWTTRTPRRTGRRGRAPRPRPARGTGSPGAAAGSAAHDPQRVQRVPRAMASREATAGCLGNRRDQDSAPARRTAPAPAGRRARPWSAPRARPAGSSSTPSGRRRRRTAQRAVRSRPALPPCPRSETA